MPILGKFFYQRIANKRQKPITRFAMDDTIKSQNTTATFDPNRYSFKDYLIEYIMEEDLKIKNTITGVKSGSDPLIPGQQKAKVVGEAPKPKYVNTDPIYKIGTIVFLLPRSNSYGPLKGSIEYPNIGSPYEIDCKITSVSEEGAVYKVITGNGIPLAVGHNQVTTHDKKHLFLPNSNVEVIEDTELFPAGTIFTKKDDYFINEALEIFIHESRFVVLKTKQINLEK